MNTLLKFTIFGKNINSKCRYKEKKGYRITATISWNYFQVNTPFPTTAKARLILCLFKGKWSFRFFDFVSKIQKKKICWSFMFIIK